MKDQNQQVRSLLRSKNIDMLSNCGYNLTNGQVRNSVEVPEHKIYNPPGSRGSQLNNAGREVFGGGFAGRQTRMPDRLGKRVGNVYEEQVSSANIKAPL
jgi:hypothetical protein